MLHCPSQPVENEMNFILKCPLYDVECLILMIMIRIIIPNILSLPKEEHFKIIISNNDSTVLDALWKHIYTCHKKRSDATIVTTDLEEQ